MGIPLLTFIIGIMVGLAGSAAWFSSTAGRPPTLGNLSLVGKSSLNDPTMTSSVYALPASSAISVAHQQAGNVVIVESVTVPPPGVWVAVREFEGRSLGNTLGAARATGTRTHFSISLLRNTEIGGHYAIELYRDDGNGSFDPATDSVYVDFDTGGPAVAYFNG